MQTEHMDNTAGAAGEASPGLARAYTKLRQARQMRNVTALGFVGIVTAFVFGFGYVVTSHVKHFDPSALALEVQVQIEKKLPRMQTEVSNALKDSAPKAIAALDATIERNLDRIKGDAAREVGILAEQMPVVVRAHVQSFSDRQIDYLVARVAEKHPEAFEGQQMVDATGRMRALIEAGLTKEAQDPVGRVVARLDGLRAVLADPRVQAEIEQVRRSDPQHQQHFAEQLRDAMLMPLLED